jgi:membrane protease YdiL (CAAX protease family)
MVGVFALMLAAAACSWPASRTLGRPPLLLEATAVILLVPLAEELYFRGAWLAILRAKLGAVASTLVVSVVFGLLHRGQGQLLSMFIASCVLCTLTLWTRTILWAVAVHAVWNALTLVVRLPPGAGRIGVATAVTVVALAAVVWQLSRTSQDES